jgi:hypothetical protein
MNSKNLKVLLLFLFLFSIFPSVFYVGAQDTSNLIKTGSETGNNKIAPGEILPVSLKLVNFGSQKRVDVIVTYQILDSKGEQVFSDSETVAVDTTASFIKKIKLPDTIKPGVYTVQTSMKYPYQEAPAVSRFQINVENKIGGFFIRDLFLYGAIILVLLVIAAVITYFLSKKRPDFDIDYHDYSDKPEDQIIFYEILSDIISEMRLRIGDDALKIAEDIAGLRIEAKTGKVLEIKDNPAKIIAELVSRYEKLLGKKVSFSIRTKNKRRQVIKKILFFL